MGNKRVIYIHVSEGMYSVLQAPQYLIFRTDTHPSYDCVQYHFQNYNKILAKFATYELMYQDRLTTLLNSAFLS